MKTLKTVSLISGFVGLAGVLLAPAALSAPGKGWDVFNAGQGDAISASSQDRPGSGSAGKGWDMFSQGQGAPIPVANTGTAGTSSAAAGAGKGWDVFWGEGAKL